jgi:hypothetical protein
MSYFLVPNEVSLRTALVIVRYVDIAAFPGTPCLREQVPRLRSNVSSDPLQCPPDSQVSSHRTVQPKQWGAGGLEHWYHKIQRAQEGAKKSRHVCDIESCDIQTIPPSPGSLQSRDLVHEILRSALRKDRSILCAFVSIEHNEEVGTVRVEGGTLRPEALRP